MQYPVSLYCYHKDCDFSKTIEFDSVIMPVGTRVVAVCCPKHFKDGDELNTNIYFDSDQDTIEVKVFKPKLLSQIMSKECPNGCGETLCKDHVFFCSKCEFHFIADQL